MCVKANFEVRIEIFKIYLGVRRKSIWAQQKYMSLGWSTYSFINRKRKLLFSHQELLIPTKLPKVPPHYLSHAEIQLTWLKSRSAHSEEHIKQVRSWNKREAEDLEHTLKRSSIWRSEDYEDVKTMKPCQHHKSLTSLSSYQEGLLSAFDSIIYLLLNHVQRQIQGQKEWNR